MNTPLKSGKSQELKVSWLVTKSTPSELNPKSIWRLPKGWIDDENGGKNPGPAARGEGKASQEELEGAVLREVKEEGGIQAKIIRKIGTEKWFFTFENQKILKFCTFYLMEWEADVAEGPGFETSEIAWLPFDEAKRRLSYSGEKRTLDKARQILEAGVQENLV